MIQLVAFFTVCHLKIAYYQSTSISITPMEGSANSVRYAVVTGANKGLGLGIAKLLASKGIAVVLTARDQKRGLEAVEELKHSGLSLHHRVVFHQLDVVDPCSIASLSDYINTEFGKLDILEEQLNVWNRVTIQNYELAEECLNTNYYGAKRTAEALLPLLQLSDSPRIVNISASVSMLKNVPNLWANEVLGDAGKLTEERIDEVLCVFLNDFKEDSLESGGWPRFLSAYILSQAAMNAHTRVLAKKYPNFCINCICPGFVKTDINNNTGKLSIEEAAINPVRLAMLPNGGPSGLFFVMDELSSFSVKNNSNNIVALSGIVKFSGSISNSSHTS